MAPDLRGGRYRMLSPLGAGGMGEVFLADRARGRAMLETALADFRTLEMVLHANLAEKYLQASSSGSPTS